MNFICQLGEKWHTDIRIWINANEWGKTMTTPANRGADKKQIKSHITFDMFNL